MTEEERILEQVKQAYPNLNDEQLCLTIISLDKKGTKQKIHNAKRRRFWLTVLLLVKIEMKYGKTKAAAIRAAQKFAKSHGEGKGYVKTKWKRLEKNPEQLDSLIHDHFLEIIPQLDIQGAITVDSSTGIRTVDSLKLWNLVFDDSYPQNKARGLLPTSREDFLFVIRQSWESGWVGGEDDVEDLPALGDWAFENIQNWEYSWVDDQDTD